ncbi:uncharacterized protein LOC131147775 [Malania oleifera]|uniref:uncharacterized protein LOC131147775 n=1 Tax=Malania oleifera TaxID=397392 RepID=UPI0025AE413A|nr:uncharacterized protein LOC131147775 [Malania oleifera]
MIKEGKTNLFYGEASLRSLEPPFTREVMEVPLPSRFKMPTFERYKGLSDPIDHLYTFGVLMQLQGTFDVIMCQAFAATLKGSVRDWYRTLRPESIGSFLEMVELFTNHFLSSRRIIKTIAHLMIMVQGEREMLKKFVHHFNAATLEIHNLNMGVVLETLTTTLQPGSFLYSLGKKPPVDMGELMARAQNYINLEEMIDTRRNRIELKRKSNSRETGESSRSMKRQETSMLLTSPKVRGQSSKFPTYTPLNVSRSEVLMQIWKKDYVSWPEPMRTLLHKRNMSKFCQFHRDHEHNTEECIQLKNEIEALIKMGYLSRFIKKEDPQREPHEQRRPNANEKEERVIGSGCNIDIPPQDEIPYAKRDRGGQGRSNSSSKLLRNGTEREDEGKRNLNCGRIRSKGEYPQISTVDEDIASVPLNGHQKRCIQIRSRLPDTLRAELRDLLNEFANMFT